MGGLTISAMLLYIRSSANARWLSMIQAYSKTVMGTTRNERVACSVNYGVAMELEYRGRWRSHVVIGDPILASILM